MTERFQLIEEVGRGAMGVVWKAHDNERNKFVAIKMLRDLHLDDPEYVERFAREVDLARSVKSPHIVRVRGYGVRQSVPFVVMEFIPGKSLRGHIIDRGGFRADEARDLLAQMADALAAVHAVGIVHRDVKASNVLLTEDSVAKLTDFGIARGRDSRGATQQGSLLGTPAYMAPEGPVDARSDIYSLGVLYYELLSGVLPFTSTHYQEVIRAHVDTMPDLSRLPASERGLTGWLLSKNPTERPQSAAALLAALQAGGASTDRGSAAQPGAAEKAGADVYARAQGPSATPRRSPLATPTGPSSSPGSWPSQAPQPGPWQSQNSPLQAPRSGGGRSAKDARMALIAASIVGVMAVMAVILLITMSIAARGH